MRTVKPKRWQQHRWLGVVTTSLTDDQEVTVWQQAAATFAELAVNPASPPRVYCLDCEQLYEDAPERCKAPAREVATWGNGHG